MNPTGVLIKQGGEAHKEGGCGKIEFTPGSDRKTKKKKKKRKTHTQEMERFSVLSLAGRHVESETQSDRLALFFLSFIMGS